MAVPYTRLVLGGPTAGGDTWSIGLSVGGLEDSSSDELSTWLTSISGDVATGYGPSSTGWGCMADANTKLASLRAYAYPDPTKPAAAQAEVTYSTPLGGGGTGHLPSEAACCASLLTGSPGRKNRGRVYVPADAAAMSGHQFDSTSVDNVSASIAALIGIVNASAAPSGGNPFVVIAGPAATNPLNVVSYVRVDSKPDVQRRREDKEAAAHTKQTTV